MLSLERREPRDAKSYVSSCLALRERNSLILLLASPTLLSLGATARAAVVCRSLRSRPSRDSSESGAVRHSQAQKRNRPAMWPVTGADRRLVLLAAENQSSCCEPPFPTPPPWLQEEYNLARLLTASR